MRKMILFAGWFFLLSGFFGFSEWIGKYLPGTNELTKDNVLLMIGLTWVAIHLATGDLK